MQVYWTVIRSTLKLWGPYLKGMWEQHRSLWGSATMHWSPYCLSLAVITCGEKQLIYIVDSFQGSGSISKNKWKENVGKVFCLILTPGNMLSWTVEQQAALSRCFAWASRTLDCTPPPGNELQTDTIFRTLLCPGAHPPVWPILLRVTLWQFCHRPKSPRQCEISIYYKYMTLLILRTTISWIIFCGKY